MAREEISLYWDNGEIEKKYTLTPDLSFTSEGVDYIASDWEKDKDGNDRFPCLIREGNLIFYGRQVYLEPGDEITVDSEPYQDLDTDFEFVTPKVEKDDGFDTGKFSDKKSPPEKPTKEHLKKIEALKEKIKAKKEGIKLTEEVIDLVEDTDKRPEKIVKSEPKSKELDKIIDDSPALKDALDEHEVKHMGDKEDKKKDVSELLEMVEEVDDVDGDPEDDEWLDKIEDKYVKPSKVKPAKIKSKKDEAKKKREKPKSKPKSKPAKLDGADTPKKEVPVKSKEVVEEGVPVHRETEADERKPEPATPKSFASLAYDAEFTARVLTLIEAEKKTPPSPVKHPIVERGAELVEARKDVGTVKVEVPDGGPFSNLAALSKVREETYLRNAKLLLLMQAMTDEQQAALYTVANAMVSGT